MKAENFNEAIAICKSFHGTKLTINYVHENDQVSNAVPLVIHECCASVVDHLKTAKFTLSMGPAGLHVEDYCK
jgi:hypothetical protein